MRKGSRPPRLAPKAEGDGNHQAVNVRALCHRLLVRVQGGAHLGPMLNATLARQPLAASERAWITELTNGTLRHQAALDHALEQHLTQPLQALPPPVRVALRMGAYQLLYMRTMAHAAVHTSVALIAKRYGRLRGVGNAVLRAVAQQSATTDASGEDLPPFGLDSIEVYAAALSQPAWFLRALCHQLGPDEALLCARAANERPSLHLRVHSRRISRASWLEHFARSPSGKARVSAIESLPQAIAVEQSGAVHELYGYADGLFCVQDAAAQAVGHLAALAEGERVLDACAAPGGKTTHLLEMVGPTGKVVAVDVHEGRLRRVHENAARMKLDGALRTHCLDVTDAQALSAVAQGDEGPFDCVVIDAPCSGMGTLRRHPELRTRAESSLAELHETQARLLDAVAPWVKIGGALVYAVCSPLWAEGRDQALAFTQRHPEFALQTPPASLSGLTEGQAVATWPHRHGMDGFFACRFLRTRSATLP